MATHSSTLDQRIPWTEEPGRLQSIRVAQSQIRLKQVRSSSVVEAKAVSENDPTDTALSWISFCCSVFME